MTLGVYDVIMMAAIGLIVFWVGRVRPVQNGMDGTLRNLLEQMHHLTADRDRWRDLAQRTEERLREAETDVAMYRAMLKRAGIQ